MFCNHCGAPNAEGSRFCTACGGAISSFPDGKQPAASAPPGTERGLPPGAVLTADATELGLPTGAVLAHRYRILAPLGVGGMGRVYLAEDEKLKTRVAIKVLREVLSHDPGSVQRLIAEARHSMALSHPNVLRVHNFEDGEMVKFLVMEYVDGESLAACLARGKLAEPEALRIAIEICKGLEHAHEQKVIHRDVKPANIMLAKSGAIKIADFGIARECRDSVSRLTSQVDSGTLLYMSPEQLIGKSNEAGDVYSMGVVLYEMLMGQPPFRSEDITYQIREIVPDPPEGASAALRAIIIKCLEKKPERRFGAIRELREELDGTAEARRKEEARRAKEASRHEEERKETERRRQSELEAEKKKEEEARRRREDAHRTEQEKGKAVSALIAAALVLMDRGAHVEAEARLHEVLDLDPGNTDATTAFDRCRAERAASEARRQQSQKAVHVLPKPNYGRKIAIGLIASSVLALVIWMVSKMGEKNPPARIPIEGTSSTSNPQSVQQPPAASKEQNAPRPNTPMGAKKQVIQIPADSESKSVANLYGMKFVSIPAGRFMMGCSSGDSSCDGDEKPLHQVAISKGFEIGKFEVTQGQWIAVMGSNPSHFKGDNQLPVEMVSWNDIQQFLAKLNARNDGYRYRLPAEAEWEYAARGGTTGPYYGNLDAIGWYDQNSGSKTHPIGQKQPNGYGLYDMLGNVWEWCADWFGEAYYVGSPAADPKGPSSGSSKVLRGGSWCYISWGARVSYRLRLVPDVRLNVIGFRVCRERF